MQDKLLESHVYRFNPSDNGGEGIYLKTDFFSNGDGGAAGIYTNQKLTLQSYCNSASFELFGANLTPHNLRKLADELEAVYNKYVSAG